MSTRRMYQWLMCLLVLGLGSLAVPLRLAAQQDCRVLLDDPDCPPDTPPHISISPRSGTYTQANLDVVVYSGDDYGLNPGSFSVTLAGATIVNPWQHSYSRGNGSDRATNTIEMQSPNVTVTATICDDAGQCTTDAVTYTYAPPPPPPDRGAPILSLTPHAGGVRAPSSFAATAGYSTPAYVSLDVPRSATLVYSSEQAAPTGFVQVDAAVNSGTPPERMSIVLRDGAGRPVRFTNGRTENFYAAGPGTGVMRLAAQFDASGLAPRAYTYTVVVRNWWGTQYQESAPQPVRVLVVNERQSPFGTGWSLPGLMRLYDQGDGVYITQGDGTGLWFRKNASGGYDAPAGDFSQVSWTGAGWTRRYPDGTEAEFGWSGYLNFVRDRFGNRTWYGYDTSVWPHRLIFIEDPLGKRITFQYDAAGKLASVQDPGGRTASFRVDRTGNLVRITDPDGVTALRAHYERGRLMQHWDRTGGAWGFTYDAAGTLARNTLPQVMADGQSVRPTVQFRSREMALLPSPDSGSFTRPATRVTPDAAKAAIVDPRGNTTRMLLDRFGLPLRIEEQDVLGKVQVSRWERDEHGRVTRATTPQGGSTRYRYSWERHNPHPVEITNQATGASVELVYEPTYFQLETVRGDAPFTQHFRSGPTLQLDSTRVDTLTTRYTHDGRGRVLSVRDPEGHQTTIAYQPGGMENTESVTRTGGAGVGSFTYGYDALGRVRSVTGPTQRTDSTAYDLLNRVIRTTAPGATTVEYGYDDLNRTYTVTDPKRQVYTTRVNALGWTESLTDPRGQTEHFAYDRSGNTTRYTNRRGQQVTFAYDVLNRPLVRTADGKTTTFAYDTAGLWTAAANEESTDTLFTAASGRLDQTVTVRGGQRYTLTPSYTNEGLRNQLAIVGPWGGRTLGYGYDGALRLNWLQDLGSRATDISYNKDGLPRTVTLPTGSTAATRLKQTLAYTPAHGVESIRYSNAGVDFSFGRRYGYDALERIEWVMRGTHEDSEMRTLAYDSLGRLGGYHDVRRWTEYTGKPYAKTP